MTHASNVFLCDLDLWSIDPKINGLCRYQVWWSQLQQFLGISYGKRERDKQTDDRLKAAETPTHATTVGVGKYSHTVAFVFLPCDMHALHENIDKCHALGGKYLVYHLSSKVLFWNLQRKQTEGEKFFKQLKTLFLSVVF